MTDVIVHYQQNDTDQCLICGFASALFYIGLKTSAQELYDMAEKFEHVPSNMAVPNLLNLVVKHIPVLGGYKVYNTFFHKKRKRRNKRWITIEEVCKTTSPFPFLVILRGNDGSTNHAVTIIDDIIFDSTLTVAMKLVPSSFDWICGELGCDGIHVGIHFLDGYNTKQKLVRSCVKNW